MPEIKLVYLSHVLSVFTERFSIELISSEDEFIDFFSKYVLVFKIFCINEPGEFLLKILFLGLICKDLARNLKSSGTLLMYFYSLTKMLVKV